ncbi:HU family DNA-binding protein [Marispirochaeta aestuarii]|uniref:Integration host factor subunit beta n=1 Tax=Marispirochaeta aestuarii TaxID=1963862 RepID=A0A1Y1S2W9_9SPIO|nr:HU family DNA-binding protein [Marispirochaeta aestuarii]ORC38267.1 integration host factor subunit beta [Marispirochaeta aestuarii]
MSNKLTKAEIIDSIFEKTGVNRKDVHRILDEFFDQLKDGLQEDRVVELRGFGTFEIRTRKGREKARNPKTGEIVPVSAHGVAVFRPGKELKQIAWPLRT